MGSVSLGQRISVRGEPGVVRFYGPTQFAPGYWVGVELDSSRGRNNGSVQGVKYFDCDKPGNVGVFIRAEALDNSRPESPGAAAGPDVKAVVNKLQVKLKAAMVEIGRSKESIEALTVQLESSRRQQEELEESLEQSTVDVEYLRSHNAELLKLLESLQEKYDLLSADFSIVNEELEIHKELEAAVSSQEHLGPVSIEDFQILLQHNKKLELALTSLQKTSEDAQLSRAETLKLLAAKSSEFESLNKSHNELTQKFEAAGLTIAQLQEELELSAELALIIDHLTSENENLQAKIADLSESVKELTELHEMDRSIEENHMLVEQDFKNLVEKLQSEISSHKKHLGKLQTTNNLLLKELADLKQKLTHDKKPIHAQEFEQLMLESKKLKLRESQSSFAKSLLEGNIESILEVHSQLVPEKYRSQIKTIVTVKKCISSCSSLISQLTDFPKSSAKLRAYLTLSQFSSTLVFLMHITEYAHYSSTKENEKIEELVSRLDEQLLNAIGVFVPMDLYTLDLSFAEEAIQSAWNFTRNLATLKSNRADYIYSFMKYQLEVSVQIAKEISSTYLEGKDEFQDLNSGLVDFFKRAEQLNVKLDHQQKLIRDNAGREMVGELGVSGEAFTITPILIALFKDIESEVGLEDNDLAQKLTRCWSDITLAIRHFEELSSILLKDAEFEPHEQNPIYNLLAEAADGETKEAAQAKSIMEQEIMEKTQKIQDMYLQIELLEKNMSTTLAGKDSELEATRNLLASVRDECRRLKEYSEDLLLANKELLEQLDALRSVDHFSEYQQVPAFENLKAMRDYTNTMALVDEINLLKRMVRHGGDVGRKVNESWLDEPLAGRRNKSLSVVAGGQFLSVAQKKRREAVKILKAIIADRV